MIDRIIRIISDKLAGKTAERFSTHFFFIFFFSLPLLVIASFSLINSYQELTNFTLERRGAIASLAASVVEEKLDRIIDVGSSLATRVQFRKMLEARKWDEAVKLMSSVPRDFPYIDRVSIFDRAGTLQAVTDPTPELLTLIGSNLSYRDYYHGVSKDWKPYVAETIKPAVPLGYNLVPVAIPTRSESGEILGFLLLSVKLDAFAHWAEDVDVGPDGFAYIVDSKGHLVVHPTLLPAEEVIDFSSVISVQKVLTGERGVEIIFNQIENEERVTAYEPITKYGWGVIIAQPTKTAFASRNQEILKLFIPYSLMIIFGIFLGFIFLNLLSRINNYRLREEYVLRSIGDGIITIDRFWNVTMWNKAAEMITGWSEQEVLGKPLREHLKLIRESDRQENIGFIEKAMVYGQIGFLENSTVVVRKDGKEVSVGDSAAPIFDDHHQIIGAIIIFRDVSQEKEANVVKTDFAYASHQLNTPVNKTLWLLESAQDEEDLVKIKEKIGNAYKSALSTQKLTSQLFDVSGIDQRMVIPRPESVKLSDLMNMLLEDGNKALKITPDIKLDIEPVSPVIAINTDIKLFRKALGEIIDNAIKYSKPNGIINVRTEIENNNLMIKIKDEGIGIPADQQPIIFTKFFRGNNVNTTKTSGAGMGLFLAREYIKMLGGKVWFQSTISSTTFFISLPISK